MKKFLWMLLLSAPFMSGCAMLDLPAPLTPEQVQLIQTHEIDGGFETTYKAVLNVLQNRNYVIRGSDYDGGFIQAETRANSDYLGNTNQYFVTGTLEPLSPERTQIRLSILREAASKDVNGINRQSSSKVEEPEMYQSLFQDIQAEVYRRKTIRNARGFAPPVSSQPAYVAPQVPKKEPLVDVQLTGLSKNFAVPADFISADKRYRVSSKDTVTWFAVLKGGEKDIKIMQERSRFEAIWYDPSNRVFSESTFIIPPASPSLLRVSLDLSQVNAALAKGKWRVRISLNHEIVDEKSFEVTG